MPPAEGPQKNLAQLHGLSQKAATDAARRASARGPGRTFRLP
jgi:hypothetical protein